MEGQKKKILLVEDDDTLAEVYRQRLELEGFDVRRSNNGEDALKDAVDYHPDLILLDVMMPSLNGFDVLDILRNSPQTRNIHIIMLTALSISRRKSSSSVLMENETRGSSNSAIRSMSRRMRSDFVEMLSRAPLSLSSSRRALVLLNSAS